MTCCLHEQFFVCDNFICHIKSNMPSVHEIYLSHKNWPMGRLKCLATGLDAFLSSLSTSRRCSRNRSPSRLPVSPMYNFLQRVQLFYCSIRIVSKKVDFEALWIEINCDGQSNLI